MWLDLLSDVDLALVAAEFSEEFGLGLEWSRARIDPFISFASL